MASLDDASVQPAPSLVAAPTGLSWRTVLGPVAVVFAMASALVTFLVLSGLTPVQPTHETVVTVLLINAALVLVLLVIITLEVLQIVRARQRGRAAARLHVRIIALFSVISAVPVMLLAAAASFTLDRGLDRWFSARAQQMLEGSVVVAQTYVREQANLLRGDLMAMAVDTARARIAFDNDRPRFRQFLNAQATVRGLPTAMMITRDLTVVERAQVQFGREYAIPPATNLTDVGESEPAAAVSPGADAVVAVVKLSGYDDLYLYVARPLDPTITDHLRMTQSGALEYRQLQSRRVGVQIAFALLYALIALTVLLSAVLIGIRFADRLVAPIRRIIGAAQLVSGGNLYVQVPLQRAEGDMALLGETFNKMTRDLRTQRDDIVRARDQIDQRRRFTEAVLSGVSAGVIGLDEDGRVTIMNRTAERLLGVTEAESLTRSLATVVPELQPLIEEARGGLRAMASGNVTVSRGTRERQLSVRVTGEQSSGDEHRFVVTLDDITALVTAQRTSAWADVARRIAHEIKNPLTPIQLSAERIRRKYGKVIIEDREVFEQCTDTIVRQVDDIRRMVDEFSAFARMPKPVIAADDVAELVRQTVFLMRVGNPTVNIDAQLPADSIPGRFDRRMIGQALTNIIKNGIEAIEGAPPDERHPPRIIVAVSREADQVAIDVIDNGIGFPKENRSRLLEPYVTTREKGTGLGLAIVGKILEEHGGGIELRDAPAVAEGGRGAMVRLKFQIGATAETVVGRAPQGADQKV
jgi:two-component system nitrogen regulation sensor histidine kinase NtrY